MHREFNPEQLNINMLKVTRILNLKFFEILYASF